MSLAKLKEIQSLIQNVTEAKLLHTAKQNQETAKKLRRAEYALRKAREKWQKTDR